MANVDGTLTHRWGHFDFPARKLVRTTLALAAALAASPLKAQTYDPRYPICLQIYGINGGYSACGYTSMNECAASARGRAAQCINNPFFAQPQPLRQAPGRTHRRQRG
jgi:Protein of unknown function (DUF3551)